MHADNMKVIERECRKNIKACKNNLKMLKKLRKEDKRKPDTVQQGLRERVHRLLERHQDEEEGQEGSTGQFEVQGAGAATGQSSHTEDFGEEEEPGPASLDKMRAAM